MLRASGVTKRFGSTVALDRLDLQVDPGEVLCLLGANGAGKTTTVRLFLGFTAADEGRVEVDGVDPTQDPVSARKVVAYIPEDVMLYDELTGLENLRLFDRMGGGARSGDEYLEILAAQGLAPGRAQERVAGYSKGMRQKVGLGIAAARRAKALLLDEPMSGLDPSAANEFARAILAERDRGAAVLLTTHDIFRAKSMATRIGIMRAGVLAETLDAAAVDAREIERLYLHHMQADSVPAEAPEAAG
ncbi:MAG: ATP-binding cassette domain-containing protein [Acidobacteriota bacterium]